MSHRLNFCFDQMSTPDLGYPNLAQCNLSPDEFDVHWPRALPVRLFCYFPEAGIQTRSWLVQHAPAGSWYPIGLGWHDFDCDYFSLLADITRHRVSRGEIRLLFYYHEGDNPARIKQRMDSLCQSHGFPTDAYVVISANSASRHLENMIYFPDHELFFRYVNRRQLIDKTDAINPSRDFTVLNRTHKWWRATCMADLHRRGLLDNSLWSYNHSVDIGDRFTDNPISIEQIPGLSEYLWKFLEASPYTCDNFNDHEQNDHEVVNQRLYHDSWCHIVLETHFDADQSGGTFLTEKTYKCIKFGQPFVIVGPAGSLAALRDRGYRVFDHAIDNSYDDILDNTQRWIAIRNCVAELKSKLCPDWFEKCRKDIEWNQHHYLHAHGDLLEDLIHRLYQLSTVTP